MKISLNEKLIKRNKAITQYTLYGAVGLIAVGLIMTLTNTNNQNTISNLSYLVLLPAYLLMQINAMMIHKWGQTPREDEIISSALKGLDNRYSLYHYTTAVPHLLVGPGGIWVINANHQPGQISYDEKKKKYIQKGGGNILTKVFTVDTLSDIERDSKKLLNAVKDYFQKMEINDYPEPEVVNVFYHPKAKIDAKNAPELTIHIDKLKDLVRRKERTMPAKIALIEKILKKLPLAE